MDWVEFKVDDSTRFSVRPDYVTLIDEATTKDKVILFVECGGKILQSQTCEPYEQVKKKIEDASRVDLSNIVVEHFNEEEYERMLALAEAEQLACVEEEVDDSVIHSIVAKLRDILKKDS